VRPTCPERRAYVALIQAVWSSCFKALSIALWVLSSVFMSHALAQSQNNSPSIEASVAIIKQAQQALVLVTTRSIEGAPSERTLGRSRQGTGVVIGPDNLILTIGYLVLEAEHIEVRTFDQRQLPARLVGYDQATGFALIKPLIPSKPLPAVPLGSTQTLTRGEALLVAAGMDLRSLAAAELIDVRPFTGFWEYHLDRALYTSPPFAMHSGAGLFNKHGELMGIGSLVMNDVMPPQHPESLPGNMFVPAELLGPILNELLTTGTSLNSQRPWLGLNAQERNGRIVVTRVSPNGPAFQAGLKPGHRLIALNGQAIESLAGFYKQVWALPLSSKQLQLTVLENSNPKVLDIAVQDRNASIAKPAGI